jgi:hypothetical protein
MTFRDDIDMSELRAIRDAELREADRNSADSCEAYRAGSASASVMRDYTAGRVSTRTSRRPARPPVR